MVYRVIQKIKVARFLRHSLAGSVVCYTISLDALTDPFAFPFLNFHPLWAGMLDNCRAQKRHDRKPYVKDVVFGQVNLFLFLNIFSEVDIIFCRDTK